MTFDRDNYFAPVKPYRRYIDDIYDTTMLLNCMSICLKCDCTFYIKIE